LRAQAQMVLARGDVDAFAELLTQTERSDPQRGFEAQLALIDAGLAAARQAQVGIATRIFVALADAVLASLEREPSEPVLLNLAGVACYELWSLDGAQDLFKAAVRLDPGFGDPRRNLDEVTKRRRAAGQRTRPLHGAVPGLARRARAVARRARPATGLTLSLCMIVRDEEQMLPRCLEAAAPAVDEIVVVDTGSTDATVQIARSFGANVIEHPWTGSFSEARNVSFEAATGDWLIYLDADEVLAADDAQRLRELTGQTWREAFYLVETSYVGELGDGSSVVNNALRVFRNRPSYRFKDRLHEQIQYALPTFAPGRIAQSTVRVAHYGYLGSVRDAKEKSQRNVELLRRQAAEAATPTPFLHFNLGSEYAAAGDPVAAATELQTALTLLERDGSLRTCEYGATLFVRLVTVLRMSGRLEEARRIADRGLELFADLTDLVLAQARIAQARGELDEAFTLLGRCTEMGDASARYGAMVGGGTFLPRLALAELELERGDTASARAHLAWCVEHHPEFLAVAGPYATVLLRDGVDPAQALAELERLDRLPDVVRLTVAAALAAGGARAVAIEQYRLGLAGADSARARAALAELLLSGGDWDEAAEQAQAIPETDPYAGLACRIELCALIGRADDDIVDETLARAGRAGLPAAELQVFETWLAIARGADAPAQLPVAAAPLLGVLLQNLLRAGDGERFTALLPALEGSRLDARERRELLATMYLAHGLLGPAAQEWMAACGEGPDARALVGLAQVAQHHGAGEDALTFARGALELEPACQAALDLVAQMAPAPAAVAA
ncbi:MAG: glycosyltransferase, partial [Solirubrobacteraceae bacterium]